MGRRPSGEARRPCLGVDVGGVIVDRVAEDSDTSFFGNNPMNTPAVAGAVASLTGLCEVFGSRMYIISKAGPRIADLTRAWLHHIDFFTTTGFDPENLIFVRKRPEKGPVCQALGITHFVDDRLDVLEQLTTVDHRYLFLGGLGKNRPPEQIPSRFRHFVRWDALARELRLSVAQRYAP